MLQWFEFDKQLWKMNIYTVGPGETTFVYLNKSIRSHSKSFTLKIDFIN